MIIDYEVLKVIWWLLVGVLFIGFTLTDGFDMGVGTLLPFVGKTDDERRVAINTVAPHWDGNQVWFILAGGAIFAAWPAVYAAAFSGFYIAMMLTLFALFFRPVGFDYRSKLEDPRWRNAWDWGLFASGTIPPVIFGVAFGNLLLGVPFHYDEVLRPEYTGSFWGLLNPFALVAGLVSLAMFVMHGGVYLQWRSEGSVNARAKLGVRLAGIALIVLFALAGIWLWLGIDGYRIVEMQALDALPNPTAKEVVPGDGAWLLNYSANPEAPLALLYPWTWAAPILGFLGAFGALLLSARNRPALAFIASSLSVVGVIMTAGIALFPFVMPSLTVPSHSLTVWDSPSSHLTLTVMFWSTMLFLPIVLSYTLWCYRALWGKVTVEQVQANSHSLY